MKPIRLRFKKPVNYDYWKTPEEGYPKKVWWKVVAGPPGYRLDILQEYDLVFSKKDEMALLAL